MKLQEKLKHHTPIDNFRIENPIFQAKLLLLQSWKRRFDLKINLSLNEAEVVLTDIFNAPSIASFKSSEFVNIVWEFTIDAVAQPFYLFYSKRGLEIQVHDALDSESILCIIDFFADYLKVTQEEIDTLIP